MSYKPGLTNYIARQMGEKEAFLYFALASLAALGTLLIGERVFFNEYVTTDEHSYIYEAWLFSQGKLSLSCPQLTDAFFHRMIICDDQVGWVSRYPPAQILWLVPGVVLGYPRLMTAVAAFLAVWFLIKAGRRLDIPGWCSALLLMISPYFWLMQGTVLSHTSALAVTALMIWAYLVWIQERKIPFAVIAGLAWGFLFLGRSYTAIWIALPFAVDALFRLAQTRTRPMWVGTFSFAVSAGTGILGYLAYNYLITGDALHSTFLHYDPSDTLGFGVRHGHLFTPEQGWEYIKTNINALNVNLWGFKGSLWVWLALSLFGWRKRISAMFLAVIFLVWLAYGAFWFRGITDIQPVYYYETLTFMVLAAGMGVSRLFRANWRVPDQMKSLAVGLLIVVVSLGALKTFDTNAEVVKKRMHYLHTKSQAIHSVPAGSIVILDKLQKWGLVFNPHGLDSDPMVVRDVYGVSLVLPRLFPDRTLYELSAHSSVKPRLVQDGEHVLRIIPATGADAKTGKRNHSVSPVNYIALESEHKAGLLAYRVRQYMLPGLYEITFILKASGKPGDKIGHIELHDQLQDENLQTRILRPGDRKVMMRLNVYEDRIVEPRLYFDGSGQLEFDRIEIRLLQVEPEPRKASFPALSVQPLLLLSPLRQVSASGLV